MADVLIDLLNQILARQVAIEQRLAMLPALDARLAAIDKRLAITHQLAILCAVQTGGILDMTLNVNDILAKVTAQGTVIGSVETAFGELNQRLKDAIAAGAPLATLQQISDELDANTNRIARAAAAGTAAAHELGTDPQPQPQTPADPPADPNA